jgi:hypothetical protein
MGALTGSTAFPLMASAYATAWMRSFCAMTCVTPPMDEGRRSDAADITTLSVMSTPSH